MSLSPNDQANTTGSPSTHSSSEMESAMSLGTGRETPSDRFPKSARGSAAGGQPIGELMHQALAYPDLISLAAGFVDDGSLPVQWTAAAFQALQQDGQGLRKGLQYGSNQGDRQLRQSILDFSFRDFPTEKPIDCDQVLVTSGSNQLLHLLSDALFDAGDIVLTAAPTYFVYLGTLKNMGVRTFGVESDEQGLCPIALERTLSLLESQGLGHRVKGVYLIPYFDNPASTTIGKERRVQIADILERWRRRGYDTILLADYAYQELGFEPTDVPPWRSLVPTSDRYVIELGTFSKSFSPGMRIGWGIFPEAMMELMRSMKANIDFGSPNLNQQLMLRVLQSGCLKEHLETLRLTYREKCEAMLLACDEHFSKIPGAHWYRPRGGLYVWLELPSHLPTGTHSPLFQKAIEKGVLYVPGEYCFPDEGVAKRRSSIRLTFGVQSVDRIRQGIALLAEASLNLESRV